MRIAATIVLVALVATAGHSHASDDHDMRLCSGKAPTLTAKAIDACNRLMRKVEGNSRRLSRLYLLRGNQFLKAGQPDRAIRDYNEAIRHHPQNRTALYNRGSAYRSLKRHQEAIADFTRCLAIAPRFHLARLERGMSHLATRQFQQAIRDFTEGMGPAEIPYFLLLRGRAYLGAKMKDRAIADFRKALKLADAAITVPAKKIRKEARKELRRLGVSEN